LSAIHRWQAVFFQAREKAFIGYFFSGAKAFIDLFFQAREKAFHRPFFCTHSRFADSLLDLARLFHAQSHALALRFKIHIDFSRARK
jgi:hypothetical protein